MTTTTPDVVELEDDVASHHWQLASAVRGVGTRAANAGPARALLVVGGLLVGLGAVLIVLAWIGAANTTDVFEQIPYMISGGLLGLALVFIGGFCYFTYWQTELVHAVRRESTDTRAVLESLHRIETLLSDRP
jgi:CHASE3 domain sensor protein